jgi:hypothetical protein
MHRAYVRNACRSFASCAAVGLPPLGWSFRQASAALLGLRRVHTETIDAPLDQESSVLVGVGEVGDSMAALAGSGIDVDSPRFKRAARACRKLQPKPASATARQPTAAQQQAMLRFARCMRSHGVPNFPDPQPGGALDLAQKVAAPDSPQFKAAERTCRDFVPGAPIPAAPPTRKPTP